MSDDDPIDPRLPSYEVHHAGAEKMLRSIGGTLKEIVGKMPGWGFSLFLFEYGDEVDHGSLFYVSSAERGDTVKMLKEFIAKQEK